MTKRAIPWDSLQLANLCRKCRHKRGEEVIKYLWHDCLTRGDCIVLEQKEVDGFWAPGVFLSKGSGPNTKSCAIDSMLGRGHRL